jgi:hypothetical protein
MIFRRSRQNRALNPQVEVIEKDPGQKWLVK